MGLFTELRRSITRLWSRTEQAVGEAYGNEALEYEGEADEAKIEAEEAADGHQDAHRMHGRRSGDAAGDSDPDDDGIAGASVR